VRSALESGKPERMEGLGRSDVTGWHPGLLSGLALAGANREPSLGEEDGILTALEVAEMDLFGVQMVVLSACETGLGKATSGEGLLGLQRAFSVAGAHTTVASLWAVDDDATALLLVRFYQNLLGTRAGLARPLGKAQALREATRWLRNLTDEEARGAVAALPRGKVVAPKRRAKEGKPYAHPFYWAAFVLAGDWR
jgi:CHAT domain-containing protein